MEPTKECQVVWKPGTTLDEMKLQAIFHALVFFKGNAAIAANSLDISAKTILNLIYRDDRFAEFKRKR